MSDADGKQACTIYNQEDIYIVQKRVILRRKGLPRGDFKVIRASAMCWFAKQNTNWQDINKTQKTTTHQRVSVEEKDLFAKDRMYQKNVVVVFFLIDLEKSHKKTVLRMLNKSETERFEGIERTFNQKRTNTSRDTDT